MPRLADFALIVFDMDGVLVRTDNVHSLAFSDLWRKVGVEGPEYSAIAGQTTREAVRTWTASLGPSPDQLASWVDFKQQRARRYLRTHEIGFADTVPSLENLRKRGFELALGTGASRISTDAILQRLDVTGLFSIVVTAEDIDHGKPNPEVYRAILDRTGKSPESTLIVEDSATGLEAALRSQCWTVSVRTGLTKTHPRFLCALDNMASLLTL